jgi:hypothetical protein
MSNPTDPDFFTGRTGGREVETEARILGFVPRGVARRLRSRRSMPLGSNNKNLPFLPSSRPPCKKIWGLSVAGRRRGVTS